jgi:hypothetical protein
MTTKLDTTHSMSPGITDSMTDIRAAGNSLLPQLAVTCKIEAECTYQTSVQVDSEVLRNRQLRQHAKRYQQSPYHRKTVEFCS